MSRENDLAALIGARPGGRRRQRAPKRAGHRAQLTVPEGLWTAIGQIADQLGSTRNDVLVRMASQRLAEVEGQARVRRLARERWDAFLAAERSAPQAGMPSAEELVEAAQDLRRDLAGSSAEE